MSITRTARGTTHVKSSATSTVTMSVTIGTTGSSLVVGIGQGGNSVSSVTWGSATLNNDGTSATVPHAQVYSAHNLTAGTQTLTVTFNVSGATTGVFAIELNGSNGVLSSLASDAGSGTTNPATTTPAITGTVLSGAQVAWIAALCVNRSNLDAAPTWTTPSSAGQKDGTTGSSQGSNEWVAEGFQIDSTTLTQSASATMATAAAYAMVMVVYQEPAAVTISADMWNPGSNQPYPYHSEIVNY